MKTIEQRRWSWAGIYGLLLGTLILTPMVAAMAASPADTLLQQLETAHPGTRFTKVSATPIAGLYQVQMESNHAYVLASAPRYFLFGTLFDTETLTEIGQRQDRADSSAPPTTAPSVAFDELPLADAIKTVRGKGTRRVAVFSDPACPYCRQLEQQLNQLDHVTLYTFPLAYLGDTLPRAIWCASDPRAAWQQQMKATGDTPVTPLQAKDCANPLQRTMNLARRLGIQATPTLIYADGSRSSGVLDLDTLKRRVDASTPAVRSPTAQPVESRP